MHNPDNHDLIINTNAFTHTHTHRERERRTHTHTHYLGFVCGSHSATIFTCSAPEPGTQQDRALKTS